MICYGLWFFQLIREAVRAGLRDDRAKGRKLGGPNRSEKTISES